MTIHPEIPSAVSTLLEHVGKCNPGAFLNIGGDMNFVVPMEEFSESPQVSAAVSLLLNECPQAAAPVFISKEANGQVSATVAGIDISGHVPAAIDILFEALEMVDEIIPDRTSEASAYVFGYDNKLNPNQRLMTAWGRSPIEALAKFHIATHEDFANDPVGAVSRNIHDKGVLTMRTLDTWEKQDVDALNALLVELVSVSVRDARLSEEGNDLDMG